MHRNGHFSWHLLGRVATPWHHNDVIYPVNSFLKPIFDRTKIISFFFTIFLPGCTKFSKNSMSFPGSETSLSIPDFHVCGHPVLDNTDDLLIPNTVGTEAVWRQRFSFNHAKTHRHTDSSDRLQPTEISWSAWAGCRVKIKWHFQHNLGYICMFKVIRQQATSPPQMDDSTVFAGWRQCAPPPNTRFLGLSAHKPNGISTGSAVFAGQSLLWQTDWQTVCNTRPHLHTVYCNLV